MNASSAPLPNVDHLTDFNELLHAARTACLARIPKVKGTMLSAGCSGTWYFNWIEKAHGPLARHIGLEKYSPKPNDLPSNVEWIANSVSDMKDVRDQEVDLVFSGQNIEHIWPEETVSFLCESWRVLKPDGWIVLDSPNRALAQRYVWSHPEHTIELTAAEIGKLLTLAGFDVVTRKGLWQCRDPRTRQELPLLPTASYPNTQRLVCEEKALDDAFLWWVEAKKTAREPDRAALKKLIDRIFSKAWPERWARLIVPQNERITQKRRFGSTWVTGSKAYHGPLVFGPYAPLKPGRYRVVMDLKIKADNPNEMAVQCDIVAGDAARELACLLLSEKKLRLAGGRIDFTFVLDALTFGLQFRCILFGKAEVSCRLPFKLTKIA